MPDCTDPYIEDPCFRDPSIMDRYDIPIAAQIESGKGRQSVDIGYSRNSSNATYHRTCLWSLRLGI